MAEHYGTAILPCRVRSPKDKAMVEGTVGVITNFVLGALRNRRFLSLLELNEAIWERLGILNNAPFQKREGSRATAFEDEKAFLLPLPPRPFELSEWKIATVAPNYHISIEKQQSKKPRLFRSIAVVKLLLKYPRNMASVQLQSIHGKKICSVRRSFQICLVISQ